MVAQTLHPSRLAVLIVFLGLIAAGCAPKAEGAGPADTTPTSLANPPATSGPASAPEAPPTTTQATTTDTTQLTLDAPIAVGRSAIIPDGPYKSGQSVTLLVREAVSIDLFNRAPRLCARVNGGEEICDPSRLLTRVLRSTPAGTQGVTLELPQLYFGPEGEDDCGKTTVECRLLWLDEAGRALASPDLAYSSELDSSPLMLTATLGPEVGVATIRIQDVDSLDLAEFLTPQKLQEIEDNVNLSGQFEREHLELTLAIRALCGFGVGDPPIGSEELTDPPVWWQATSMAGGPNCDWLAVEGQPDDKLSSETTIRLQRDIYGYGGWQDCAVETCYLEVAVSWTHPLPGGSTLGDSRAVRRVLIDIPETWPSTRPSIRIIEPSPYEPGQEVTIEVRDYPYEASELDIGWCPGDEYTCYYQSTTRMTDGDTQRFPLRIPRAADDCGLNRCYFAIDSRSEGMAPSAVVVVPVLD